MLSRLSISNYALISSLDIDFPDGLIIITGETGAGKSILLGALSLLLGKRADSTIFKDNKKNCVVEAEFGDGSILRRVVTPAGRSRSFFNDEPVNLADLSRISSRLIDIHEQHQHLLLTDPDYRLSVIDSFAGDEKILSDYKSVNSRYEAIVAEADSLEKEIAADEKEADYIHFQLDRLVEAKLQPGELEELEKEQKRLANAEEIRISLSQIISLFDSGEISIVQNLKEIVNLLSRDEKYLQDIEGLSERVESCRIELDDIYRDVDNVSENIVVSPERLAEVEERMSSIYSLMRKYDCETVDDLIAYRDSLSEKLTVSGEKGERLDALRKEIENLENKRKEAAEVLSKTRKAASDKISGLLQESVRSLEMPSAFFEARVSDMDHFTASGKDRLDFLFSANGKSMLCDISKVASGGELSRVMLALKGIMAEYTSLPTMIFDEIDTGVSGRIADKMGDMIGRMGKSMQIFAITHLPQIASKRGTHFIVYKEKDENGEMATHIKKLTYEERVEEVARMLSGSSLSEAALANAIQLLNEN